MKRTTLTNTVAYRVTAEQWRRLEEEAENGEVSVHDWCREAVLEKLQNLQKATEQSSRPPAETGTRPPAETGNGTASSVNELLVLEKISRLEYLIEHGFAIQHSANRTTDEEWMRRVKDSKSAARVLIRMAMERGSSDAGMR